MKMHKFILITESALDASLSSGSFDLDSMLPLASNSVFQFSLPESIVGFRILSEPESPFVAIIGIKALRSLREAGGNPSEAYRRIARVIKGLKSPPVYLPRQWSEFHFRNLIAFFALPRDVGSFRWICEINGESRSARFEILTTSESEINLNSFVPPPWPKGFNEIVLNMLSERIVRPQTEYATGLAQEFDLETIGSKSVVEGRTYEEWSSLLTKQQKEILANELNASIRIVGPAGSGKTLTLCMRAIQVARDVEAQARGGRILVATHSWAMCERIDGVLSVLNGGITPRGITAFPLLSLLELHAGHVGNLKINVIGDDSTDGRLKCIDIIKGVIGRVDNSEHPGISPWISAAIRAPREAMQSINLNLNLYEEISGVLTASGVAVDDQESIQKYLESPREEWMPPFDTVADRGYVIAIYKRFLQELVDRSAITTDQFILDSIRVLETFSWRMRKETEGYDYIFVDELQLFDPQERAALELLGRSRRGVPFITAEDPAQGVFSAINSRQQRIDNAPIFLEVVHRFNKQIFNFISYMYQRFPLNALPLRISNHCESGKGGPKVFILPNESEAINRTVEIVGGIGTEGGRICIALLGDADIDVDGALLGSGRKVVRLESFDDIENLSYSKKSVVVAPWQFIGGAQFTHVVVLIFDLEYPNSQFEKLRELVAVYLSCSRATDTLHVVCCGHVPSIISDAAKEGLISFA
jgi:hypothetical protein